MFKRKSFSFRGRRFSRPARKQFIWTTTIASLTETAGTTSTFLMSSEQQWIGNSSSGTGSSRAKLLKVVFSLQATAIATRETRIFAVCVDDVASPPTTNPATATGFWSSTDVVHWGTADVGATAAATGANQGFSNNYLDNTRSIKANRLLKTDSGVWLIVSPAAAAGNQLAYTLIARTLVSIG